VVLLIFFVIESILTKLKYKKKEKMHLAEGNDGARGWRNVLANGGPGAIFAILYFLANNNSIFIFAYVGSLSFALSDTLATEIGMLSRSKPRSILTGREIDAGQSGGITLQGELAALTGSVVMGTLGGILLTDLHNAPYLVSAAIVAGIVSTNVDSLLGATVQAKYRCIRCKKLIEKKTIHCNLVAIREQGVAIIDNNVVNVISAIVGALISIVFIILIQW
jgi:uncharacterized protein (TIGR00297 family)